MNIIRTLFVVISMAFASFAFAQVNINKADVEQLQELDGIGEAKALAIIEHRKTHGPFKSAEELAEVKGIGDKTVAKNKDDIIVE
ncbi:MAG: ComEA family DNA-binding protein [Oleiphilaceae bacterium]|nr:ComEA family DNA-binding protein [Oleiphilaceae bacterium]